MLIEGTLFLTAIIQRMETGNLCRPIVTHTLAEPADELLQDTKGLRVEGNIPFRTGWGAKAAENQRKVSKCRESQKEEDDRLPPTVRNSILVYLAGL